MSNILYFDVKGNSMFPTFKDGDSICFEKFNNHKININDIVVCKHPFKTDFNIIKRVTKIREKKLFIEGDNKDIFSSEDSHNFGFISENKIIAIKRN
tara:strand:- start:161 stop:451 length:291 start_codon:yes stop_codon:yes gene_type:complete